MLQTASVIIVDLPCWLLHETDLFHICNGRENSIMCVNVVAKWTRKDLPFFETTVDSLMACLAHGGHVSQPAWTSIFWNNKLVILQIARISHDVLSHLQCPHHSMSEYSQIWPWSRQIWTIDPYNESSLDAYANLISQTRAIYLVGPIAGIEGRLLSNRTVHSINRNLGMAAIVINMSIFPENLAVNFVSANRKKQLQ